MSAADLPASAQATAAATAAEGDGAAYVRLKLLDTYVGRHCTVPASVRPQLEALLPGFDGVRPFNLVLPNGKQLPVAYRLSDGRIQRGWPAVHRALKLHAGMPLYIWKAARCVLRLSKKRPTAATISSSARAQASSPGRGPPQQLLDPPSARPHNQVLIDCHSNLCRTFHLG